jgi:hypothetical protein
MLTHGGANGRRNRLPHPGCGKLGIQNADACAMGGLVGVGDAVENQLDRLVYLDGIAVAFGGGV